MPGRVSQRGTPRRLWAGGLCALIVAGCAARPTPRAESASLSFERSPSSDATPSPESKPDPTVARTFGWLSLAVGAESAIVATVTSVMMLEDKSTRDSDCNPEKVCSSNGFNSNVRIGSLAAWNAGAYALAALGLGLGSYLLLTHPLQRHATLSLGPSGMSLAGSF
jgi:hypothetical protein